MATVTVEVYSDKAIVVRNALEHHGQILQSMNGMFNERLKGGRGWIFPKYMLTQIRSVVEKLNSGQYGNEFEQKKVEKSPDGVETVSKQEYLSLLSRVERLEALWSRPQPSQSNYESEEIKEDPPAKRSIEIEFEDEDEEVEVRKQLTKPVRVVENGRQSFSKPKKI